MTRKQLIFEDVVLAAMFGFILAMVVALWAASRDVEPVDRVDECIANISEDVDPLEWQFQWQECQLGISVNP